jgi:hypothetical protein
LNEFTAGFSSIIPYTVVLKPVFDFLGIPYMTRQSEPNILNGAIKREARVS